MDGGSEPSVPGGGRLADVGETDSLGEALSAGGGDAAQEGAVAVAVAVAERPEGDETSGALEDAAVEEGCPPDVPGREEDEMDGETSGVVLVRADIPLPSCKCGWLCCRCTFAMGASRLWPECCDWLSKEPRRTSWIAVPAERWPCWRLA